MNTTTKDEFGAVETANWPMPVSASPVRRAMSWKSAEEALHQLHDEFKDDPLYLWMEMSFEEMADKVNKARFCGGEDMTRDQSWMRRQDAAGRVV
ncbi:MAG: hypothetical protein HYX42_00015 [Polaromonas sp.]|uniref:hypothetical protein n=1 Tax=Polaromonas sp. TaxID=1869339 RepID=UPI0025E3FBA8|nr:hypothetical protein [Polaromonas sp.]MBI2724613.1 hypothetical protein [Polaromonas sp.]